MEQAWQAIEDFSDWADDLRQHFLDRFENPLEASENRFVWDYWHVPNQYTLIRTPAYHFFPDELYKKLENELLDYAQEELGCSEISPPWLSYYVEGCEQRLHADNPHGPWAYVYSLTDWANRSFQGGETVILRPEILSYWNHHTTERGIEMDDILQTIAPEYNQLTVFDPRLPHGVQAVKGVNDPREGRVVVHGWFTEPSLFVTGGLTPEDTLEALDPQMTRTLSELNDWDLRVTGIITARLFVDPNGKTKEVKFLTNNTVDPLGESSQRLNDYLQMSLEKFEFPEGDGESKVTIPFIFE